MGATLTASLLDLCTTTHGALRWVARLPVFAVLACAAVYAAAQTSAAPAQAVTTSLHGVVTSTDGAVYEDAHVTIETSGSGAPQTATAQTDGEGGFRFANLPAGAFKLTVAAPGFATQSISGMLRAGEEFDAHTIALPMLGAATEVTVTANSRVEIAEEQLKIEEKQRVLSVFPNYYVSYDRNPEPLTPRQKFQLAWRSSINPVTWAMTGGLAGMQQATNELAGYGQGMQGYGKRFGADYTEDFSGTMIGSALLPALLKQDPRYFYKGTGSVSSRTMYAIANAVICKGDNGRWQPNYSTMLGSLAASGLANLYYPPSDRSGVETTFVSLLLNTAEDAAQNLAQEFIVRRLTPRHSRLSATTQ